MSASEPADGVMIPRYSDKEHDYSFARDRQIQNELLAAADDKFALGLSLQAHTVSAIGLKPSNPKDKASEVTGWCPDEKVSLRKTEEIVLAKPKTSGGSRENTNANGTLTTISRDSRSRRDPGAFVFRHYPVTESYRYIEQYRREHTCSDSQTSASTRNEFLDLQRFYSYRAHTSYSQPTTVGVPPPPAPQMHPKKETQNITQKPTDTIQHRSHKYKLSPCINVRSDPDASRDKMLEDQRGSPLGANGSASRMAVHAVSKTPIAKVPTKVTVPANHSMISPSLNKTLKTNRKLSSPKSSPVWDNNPGAVRTLDTLACVASTGDKSTEDGENKEEELAGPKEDPPPERLLAPFATPREESDSDHSDAISIERLSTACLGAEVTVKSKPRLEASCTYHVFPSEDMLTDTPVLFTSSMLWNPSKSTFERRPQVVHFDPGLNAPFKSVVNHAHLKPVDREQMVKEFTSDMKPLNLSFTPDIPRAEFQRGLKGNTTKPDLPSTFELHGVSRDGRPITQCEPRARKGVRSKLRHRDSERKSRSAHSASTNDTGNSLHLKPTDQDQRDSNGATAAIQQPSVPYFKFWNSNLPPRMKMDSQHHFRRDQQHGAANSNGELNLREIAELMLANEDLPNKEIHEIMQHRANHCSPSGPSIASGEKEPGYCDEPWPESPSRDQIQTKGGGDGVSSDFQANGQGEVYPAAGQGEGYPANGQGEEYQASGQRERERGEMFLSVSSSARESSDRPDVCKLHHKGGCPVGAQSRKTLKITQNGDAKKGNQQTTHTSRERRGSAEIARMLTSRQSTPLSTLFVTGAPMQKGSITLSQRLVKSAGPVRHSLSLARRLPQPPQTTQNVPCPPGYSLNGRKSAEGALTISRMNFEMEDTGSEKKSQDNANTLSDKACKSSNKKIKASQQHCRKWLNYHNGHQWFNQQCTQGNAHDEQQDHCVYSHENTLQCSCGNTLDSAHGTIQGFSYGNILDGNDDHPTHLSMHSQGCSCSSTLDEHHGHSRASGQKQQETSVYSLCENPQETSQHSLSENRLETALPSLCKKLYKTAQHCLSEKHQQTSEYSMCEKRGETSHSLCEKYEERSQILCKNHYKTPQHALCEKQQETSHHSLCQKHREECQHRTWYSLCEKRHEESQLALCDKRQGTSEHMTSQNSLCEKHREVSQHCSSGKYTETSSDSQCKTHQEMSQHSITLLCSHHPPRNSAEGGVSIRESSKEHQETSQLCLSEHHQDTVQHSLSKNQPETSSHILCANHRETSEHSSRKEHPEKPLLSLCERHQEMCQHSSCKEKCDHSLCKPRQEKSEISFADTVSSGYSHNQAARCLPENQDSDCSDEDSQRPLPPCSQTSGSDFSASFYNRLNLMSPSTQLHGGQCDAARGNDYSHTENSCQALVLLKEHNLGHQEESQHEFFMLGNADCGQQTLAICSSEQHNCSLQATSQGLLPTVGLHEHSQNEHCNSDRMEDNSLSQNGHDRLYQTEYQRLLKNERQTFSQTERRNFSRTGHGSFSQNENCGQPVFVSEMYANYPLGSDSLSSNSNVGSAQISQVCACLNNPSQPCLIHCLDMVQQRDRTPCGKCHALPKPVPPKSADLDGSGLGRTSHHSSSHWFVPVQLDASNPTEMPLARNPVNPSNSSKLSTELSGEHSVVRWVDKGKPASNQLCAVSNVAAHVVDKKDNAFSRPCGGYSRAKQLYHRKSTRTITPSKKESSLQSSTDDDSEWLRLSQRQQDRYKLSRQNSESWYTVLSDLAKLSRHTTVQGTPLQPQTSPASVQIAIPEQSHFSNSTKLFLENFVRHFGSEGSKSKRQKYVRTAPGLSPRAKYAAKLQKQSSTLTDLYCNTRSRGSVSASESSGSVRQRFMVVEGRSISETDVLGRKASDRVPHTKRTS